MSSLPLRAIVGLGCLLSTVASSAAETDATTSTPSVAVLTYPDAPLTLTTDTLVSSEGPAIVRFTVTNATGLSIRDYHVRVFVFRASGRPTGFRSTRMTERLSRGTTHAAVVSLPEGWALQSDGIVLITITAVTFEDGSRWHAPEDSVERAKVEALHLTSTP